MIAQFRNRRVRRIRRNRDQQTTGSLRIKKQRPILFRDSVRKSDAIAQKFAIILQPTRYHAFAHRFKRARE